MAVLIDRVGLSDGPLRYAFDAARRRGGHVRVVQADSQYETAADLDAHREHLTWLLESWRSWYPGVRAETTVLAGEPAQVAWASEAGAELLVVSRSMGNAPCLAHGAGGSHDRSVCSLSGRRRTSGLRWLSHRGARHITVDPSILKT